MIKWALIGGVVVVLGLSLGACSSSGDGLLSQANLVGDSSDTCGSSTGVATGIASLNGPHAAYAQCMQDQYASGQMGYDEESGHFAPGSQPASLSSLGN
ncbi:MAG: hypothetical protein WB868_08170 [Xanthobacteraceae bacterium]